MNNDTINNQPINDPTAAQGAGVTDDDLKDLSGEEMVELFVMQMIKDKGVNDADGEIAHNLQGELINKINEAIINELPDEKIDELGERLDSVTPEELEKIVEEAGIDTVAVTESAMQTFREEYLDSSDEE